ncbi:MAG: FAD-dependent oxidoreductase [Oscillospiraceae bacterium]|nr:FAD-dependent oxidoreductase [Oscillospiraceae bacterium]
MKHVIIGTGAAGISAAKTIRILNSNDEIVMLSADSIINSRSMLHKYISGERDSASLRFVSADFFDANNISWLTRKVTSIDTASKQVLTDAEPISYDRLLIATGANSSTPPIGALQTAVNVFGLRHFTDAESIKRASERAEKFVIIGAGLVGLDAAYALIEQGKRDITIVEMGDRILPVNLDPQAAASYQDLFEKMGCKFLLGARVTDTVTSGDVVTGISLESGEILDCDLVIVATGTRPAIEFLADSNIAFERAITVDENLRTSVPDVYAAGDVTGLSGIWPNAVNQGEIAGRNMCGDNAVYEDSFAMKNTINFFGLLTLSVGKTVPEEDDVVLIREDRRNYKKLILTGDTISGVILQGDISQSGFWQHMVKNKISIAGKNPWKLSYADFYSTKENGEFAWKTG